jgi:hypothetical protein
LRGSKSEEMEEADKTQADKDIGRTRMAEK